MNLVINESHQVTMWSKVSLCLHLLQCANVLSRPYVPLKKPQTNSVMTMSSSFTTKRICPCKSFRFSFKFSLYHVQGPSLFLHIIVKEYTYTL